MKSKKSIVSTKQFNGHEDVQEIVNDLKKLFNGLSDSLEDAHQYMSSFAEEFMKFLLAQEPSTKDRVKDLAKKIFRFSDLFEITLEQLVPQIMNATTSECKWKIIWFLRFLPLPTGATICGPNRKGKASKTTKESCYKWIEKAWLEVSGLQMSNTMLLFVVPHFVEKLMDLLPNTELFSDFLYKTFNSGGYLAVISLAGIFKLILRNNFEHPNFYSDVYSTISSDICYSSYAQKFFSLVDLILSSSHVPVYIIVAFLKKLSRILLYAPLNCQLPLLTSIKNILRRHEVAHSTLLNREQPSCVEQDPYDENERDLKKCGANNSSLWEVKAIQQHWHRKVADKAQFVDHKMQDHEVAVVWQTPEQIFNSILQKSIAKLDSMQNALPDSSSLSQDFQEREEEEEDEYEPEEKRASFGIQKNTVGLSLVNEKEPSNLFLKFGNADKLWC